MSFGQQPVIGPDDADHRNVDVREKCRSGSQRRQRAEDGDEQGEHDERIGPPQRDLNDPHGSNLLQTQKDHRESDRSRRRRRNLSESRGRVTGAADAALRGRRGIEPNRRADDYVERGRCCRGVEAGTGVQAEGDRAGGSRSRLDARVTGCLSHPRRCKRSGCGAWSRLPLLYRCWPRRHSARKNSRRPCCRPGMWISATGARGRISRRSSSAGDGRRATVSCAPRGQTNQPRSTTGTRTR